MTHLSELSVEQLADGICLRAGRIAAAQAELLAWIAEFDRREGWAGPGMLSCAHWLSWRISLSLGAAREQVRVAQWLETSPTIAAAFAQGRVSYSKIRAISRVAEPDDGIDWVGLARHSSAAQLERLARGVCRAKAKARTAAEADVAEWRLRTRVRYDERGNLTLTVTGPAHVLPVIRQGLDARKEELRRRAAAPTASSSVGDDGGASDPAARVVTDADALLDLARQALDEERAEHPAIARRRRPHLTLLVDPLSGWARQSDGELQPPTAVPSEARPVRPGAFRSVFGMTAASAAARRRRHDAGRAHREAPSKLRELLGAIDGERCRFPGCTRDRKLHAHHVRYWARGGRTDLDNLVLLCGRHHTLVHAQGFGLRLRPDRQLDVSTGDGTVVAHHPPARWAQATELADGCGQRISAETLPPEHLDARLDLDYAVSVLLQQAA